MKFKSLFPYLLFGSLTLLPKGATDTQEKGSSLHAQQIVQTQTVPSTKEKIDAKAQELCDTYIDNVLQGQKNIKNSKKRHSRAVLDEFPGAVVRWYCIFGQYTQLNRAVADLGDTLSLIPFEARHSCPEFRRLMKNKYNAPEYAGTIYSGKMYKSNKDYSNALSAFLKAKRVTDSTPDSVRQTLIQQFAKNNFSVESLHPGAIVIIQKSNTPSNTHAVVYLGRGCVENGSFVPDTNGKHLYAGYNNETIADMFGTYRTDKLFVADIYGIAVAEYTKELNRIQNMEYDDMFDYVYNVPSDLYAMAPAQKTLRNMATEKYFNKNFEPATLPIVNTAKVMSPLLTQPNIIRQRTTRIAR